MPQDSFHLVTSSDLDVMTLSSNVAAVPSLPLKNVVLSDSSKLARWVGSPNPLTIRATRRSADDLAFYASGFGMARHDLNDDVTCRLRLYDEINQRGNLVYDSGAQEVAKRLPWGVMIAGVDEWGASYTLGIPAIFSIWFEPVAYKSARIDLTNPSATTIDIGRIYLGFAFTPDANFSYGSGIEWVDDSKPERTDGGGLRTEPKAAYRRFTIDFEWLNDVERERLSWLLERVTKSGDMLCSLNPNATGRTSLENTMVCKRQTNNKFTRRLRGINNIRLVLDEA